MAKVLIVGDEAKARNLIRLALSFDDHVMREANDGREGLLIFNLIEPNIVIVDFNVATIASFDFVRDLRSLPNSKQVKIIVTLSISNWLAESTDMLASEVDLFLPKPMEITRDIAVFREAVADLLRGTALAVKRHGQQLFCSQH